MSKNGKIHRLVATPKQNVHEDFFDASIPPVLCIQSGDTVVFNTIMLKGGNLRGGMCIDELLTLVKEQDERREPVPTLTGPIYVDGAEPGDVLEVRIKKLVPIEYGVNFIYPGNMGKGGLPEDFPAGRIQTFELDLKKMETIFAPGIVLPLKPFLGRMGVAPKPGERKPGAAPDYMGANLDNKELVEGSTLYLPVNAKGALFSAGDAHAAQGDGEVCITAIETAMTEAVLQFVVRKDMRLERPVAETPTHWITMGFHKDLNLAAQIALRDAIDFIAEKTELTREDAYSLSSLAVDLRVTQIVNPNKGVHAMIPKKILEPTSRRTS